MKLGSSAALLCLFSATLASAAPAITVAWREKAPYYYTENGVAQGFLLQRTKDIFAAAGIEAHFVEEPQKRIWANLEHGATNYCSISWYRLPEREAIVQFTRPIHYDPPQTLLIAPGAVAQVEAHATLASLLADPQLTLGVVDGVSYGPALDALIAHSTNQVMRRTVSVNNMMRMLAAGRASFMFADREDWNYYHAQDKSRITAVRHDFPDMPPGLKRYMVCTRDVPAAVIDKLNQAIATLVPLPHEADDGARSKSR